MVVNRNTLIGLLPTIEKQLLDGKDYDLTLVPHRERRSGLSNRYLWELIGMISEKVGEDTVEVYRREIRRIGKKRVAEISTDALPTVEHVWGMQGTGWFIDRIDQGDRDGCTLVHMYYGSSCYTSDEMARLIDNVRQDCTALGLDPSTPEEKRMIEP